METMECLQVPSVYLTVFPILSSPAHVAVRYYLRQIEMLDAAARLAKITFAYAEKIQFNN